MTMSSAPAPPAVGSASSAPHAVPDEVAMAALTELLVLRDRDDRWWQALAARTDALAAAIAAHDDDPARCASLLVQGAAARSRRVADEHAELRREAAQLRAHLDQARRDPSLTSSWMAEATEVMAVLRGHNRRVRST
jgi:hypothetical protein